MQTKPAAIVVPWVYRRIAAMRCYVIPPFLGRVCRISMPFWYSRLAVSRNEQLLAASSWVSKGAAAARWHFIPNFPDSV